MILKRNYFLPLDNGGRNSLEFAISSNKKSRSYILLNNGFTSILENQIFLENMHLVDEYEILFSLEIQKELLKKIKKFILYSDLKYKASIRNDLETDSKILKKLIKERESD